MGDFVNKVRLSAVRQPTQHGFSPEKWNAAFAAVSLPDEADKLLHEAGLFYFSKFETIRGELTQHTLSSLSQSELVHLMVATLNFMYNTVQNLQVDIKQKGVLVAEELVQAKYDGNEFGHAETPDNSITQYLDGARHPLIFALTKYRSPTKSCATDNDSVIRHLKYSMVLGQFHDVIDDCWGDTLWNDWYLRHVIDAVIISPPASLSTIERAVSGYRYQLLLLQATFWTFDIWQHKLKQDEKAALSERFLVSIDSSGKHRKYRVTKDRSVLEHPSQTLTRRLMTQETYYEKFRNEPLNSAGGATIEQLLDVWELLEGIAVAHAARFPANQIVSKPNTLKQFSPLIEYQELCNLIHHNINGVSYGMSRKIVDFLSFKGHKTDELWSAPIVPVDKKRVALVFAAIICGNLSRVCESWLKRSGLNLNSKGAVFEDHVRSRILQAMQHSPVLKTFGMRPSRLVLEADGVREEIDCVFWLGNTVLLGELKCMYLPTEPGERYNYYDNLDHAASQILRKVEFANKHVDMVIKALGLKTSPRALVPFVLSNQPFGVGFDRNGVAVTDIPSLTCYLDWGCLKHNVMHNTETGISPPLSETRFYETEAEAETRIEAYLHGPPLIMEYAKSVQTKIGPWPLLNEADVKTAIERAEVHFVDDGIFVMTDATTNHNMGETI